MTKKEIIWREILYQALEKDIRQFTQKELAAKFSLSLSTVFNALKAPREIKAVKVTGRNFILINPEKLLYLWGTHRRLNKEIIYKTRVKKSVFAIEGNMPSGIIFAAYSAYHQKFKDLPADYDKAYIYAYNVKEIKKRFPFQRGEANLIVFKADPFLKNYGTITSLGQTFVDIWNLPEWYAQDFLKELKEKLRI